MLPNSPGGARAPNTAPDVLGVPKAAPGDAGAPKPPPGDPNALLGLAPFPNAGVGVEGLAKPAQNAAGEHADHLVLTSSTTYDHKCKATVWNQTVTTISENGKAPVRGKVISAGKCF